MGRNTRKVFMPQTNIYENKFAYLLKEHYICNMNWNKIKEDYPKAISLLEKWGNHPAVLSRQKNRLLYEFFDENDIHICIDTTLMPRTTDSTRFFEWSIDMEHNAVCGHEYYDYRKEAEEVAFTKAFEIMNLPAASSGVS